MDDSIIDNLEIGKKPSWKSLKSGMILGFVLLMLGLVFKLMHWPGVNGLVCVSIGIFLAFMLMYVLFAKNDRKGRVISLTLGLILSAIWMMLFGTYVLMLRLALTAFLICIPIAYWLARRDRRFIK